MMVLSNSVPMICVVRFINPPHPSLMSVAFDRELLSPPRAGTGGRFANRENKKDAREISVTICDILENLFLSSY
jgi:hypothetical protein